MLTQTLTKMDFLPKVCTVLYNCGTKSYVLEFQGLDSQKVDFFLFFISRRKLGSVAGPVIQANGRLTFEDDLRSGGLLYFTTQ